MVIKDNANILWCALHKQIADKNLKVINHFLVNGPNKLMGFEFKSNFAKPCAQKITMQIWTDMENLFGFYQNLILSRLCVAAPIGSDIAFSAKALASK